LNVSHRKSNKMLEQELKDIWNNSSRTAQITIETSQLIEELNAKINGIQKKIRVRDTREISASVIGILIFSYLLYEIPFPMTKLACSFSIIWFSFVIYKFRKSKKQNAVTNLSLSIQEQLAYQETAMQQQVVFLSSAAYWYAIPPFITNLIFILGLGNPTDYNWINRIANSVLPLTDNMKVITLIGLAFFYGFTVWLNKRAITKGVKPLIENIEIVKQQLEKE